MKRNLFTLMMLTGTLLPATAQQMLTLDSCRALALRNNKQLSVARLNQEMALNTRKAVRTQYLPKVSALGGYELVSKEVSILNTDQKNTLNNLGSLIASPISEKITTSLGTLAQQQVITPQQAQAIGQFAESTAAPLASALNGVGSDIRQAFRTNNRNMFGAAIMVRQPIYMGGAITAANAMADIAERIAAFKTEGAVENTLYDIDQTYWLVVSLHQKNKLANSFLEVVKKLDSDVQKMIQEGVATRADGLKVAVKVNEAEMQVTQAEDGLALSKMLLCQLCGLPIDSKITLADENNSQSSLMDNSIEANTQTALANRSELKMLEEVVEMSRQSTRLARATYLPQIGLIGGYLTTNPNVYNGFEKKFSGTWNIGVLMRIPIWNWQEGAYKVRATKAATCMATLELEDAREKTELQVTQYQFKLKEASKKLAMATKNVEKAEENLRCANLGFAEGVMQTTDVMTAQTAWLMAQTQKIDAEIEVRLTQVGLQKIMGVLN